MIQRLLLLAAALVALFCESAYGLGLGKLELNSALNQEFKADIELTNTGGLTIEEILPNLASPADFDRVGVERNYLLTDLRFRIIQNDNGEMIVRVTSNRPIIEPFLNFIVEVLWPNGRLLREYTVLLDPPLFGQQGVAPITPGQTFQAERRPVPPQPESRQAPPTQEGDIVDDEYGITGAGDTLWAIALKTRSDDSVSIQQTMLALLKANPEAFINDNINLLKAGYVLRIPDRREIRQETVTSAIAEVRVQNQEFEDYRAGRVAQLDATRRQPGTGGTSTDREEGELRLLAADQSSGQRAADTAAMQALENELDVAREDLDRARRANTELNARVDELAGQLEELDKLVALKDDQLAAFRAQLQKMQEAGVDPGVAPEPVQPQQLGSLLSNPFVLGGLGILLIVGVAGGLFFMRRKRQQAGLEEDDFTEVALDDTQPEVEAPEEEAEVEEAKEDADEELAPETSDAISEAEIYIAYGRFPQAITFLQNAIQAEPSRVDIQLKLLEVYVQTEDATAFNLQLDQLKMLNDEDAVTTAEELQSRIPGASETAEAAMEATIVSSEPIAAIEEADDDLSFDLDDLDAETEDDDLDLGDELDLDAGSEQDSSVEDDGDLDLDLDADLDLDLDLGDDESGGTDDAVAASDDLSETQSLDAGDDGIELDLGDDDDGIELDLGDDDTIELDLGDDDDSIELDLGDDDGIELDLGDDDDAISLDLDDDKDINLEEDPEPGDTGDEIELDLGDDVSLELIDDSLDLGDDDSLELKDDSLELKDDGLELKDDSLELKDDGLELKDDSLELKDDSLELKDDSLELKDDSLELDDDEDLELNLDEDASSKLDLARAYIDMGDNDGAKSLLQEVISEGTEADIKEANELVEKLD
ncbi:MAG: hypothetical protein O6945_00080 [Gammaproteobacteria bacterium]|nr:hypothetical protein [Gammaproteobacteria bacterium]